MGFIWVCVSSDCVGGSPVCICQARQLKVRGLPLLCSVALVILGTEFLSWRSGYRESLVVTLGFIRAKLLAVSPQLLSIY